MSSDKTASASLSRLRISADGHSRNLQAFEPGIVYYQVGGRSDWPGPSQHDYLAQGLCTGDGDGRGNHAITAGEQSPAVQPNGIIQGVCIEYEHNVISEL